ncbi:MAG: hypothetical protein ACM3L6_06550 [Deltaproteobacteria bacterium]
MSIQENDTYIGQLLVKDGLINEEDLGRGLEEQKRTRDFLCSTLVRLGFASEERVFTVLSLQIGVPFLLLRDCPIDPQVLNVVPGNFAAACRFMPLKSEGDQLFVATPDPLNSRALDEIRAYLGFQNLKVFLAGENDVRETIRKYYGV